MKTNYKLVYLIYLLLLTAITFLSFVTLLEKPYFHTEKKLAISEQGLANKLIEFTITDEKNTFQIKKKFDFHILKIKIQQEKSFDEVSKKFNEARELILSITKNYYDTKNNKYKVLIRKLNQDGKKIEDKLNVLNIEKLVNMELFLKDPYAEFNIIKSKLDVKPEIYSVINRTKYLPIIVFLFITLLIFHFLRDKIIKSLKKL